MKNVILIMLALLSYNGMHAQQLPVLVKDIAPGSGAHSNPRQITPAGSLLYFTATTTGAGEELYITDGTGGGTHLARDIWPGPVSSLPMNLTVFNGKLFFTATDSLTGKELWCSDGTAGGTFLVKDVHAGPASSNPGQLIVSGQQLYFLANDGTHGEEWWSTDGTPGGTVMVHDLTPGTSGQHIGTAIAYQNNIIFRYTTSSFQDQVWMIGPQGNPPVHLTASIPTGGNTLPQASEFVIFNNLVYFRYFQAGEGEELFSTDGTVANTQMISINPGPDNFAPRDLLAAATRMYMVGQLPGGAPRLFVSDGTASNTVSLGVECNSLFFDGAYALDADTLYFTGTDPVAGYELWKSDGTIAGTALLKDIKPGNQGVGTTHMRRCGSQLYFLSSDSAQGQVWMSDGTPAGTSKLASLYTGAGGCQATDFTALGGKVYFTARRANLDFQLYETDGTPQNTFPVYPAGVSNSFDPLGISGNPFAANPLLAYGGAIYFQADFGDGKELYRIGPPLNAVHATDSDIRFTLYPNPAGESFTIAAGEDARGASYRLYNSLGRQVAAGTLRAGPTRVPVAELPPGMYYLTVGKSGRRSTQKLTVVGGVCDL